MAEFWLLVAFLIVVVLLWKPVRTRVLPALDERAARIRAELDEAQRLQEEAKSLLAKYQRQLHDGESLAREIMERAETEQRRLEARMKAEFEAMVARRTQQAEERIAQEEARAVAEVRGRAAELALRATEQVLRERIGEKEGKALLETALAEVDRKLH
ncbi:MAG TPA: F0F1 ATP synthase subunit B [Rhodospirillales bacterium]|nr:F0F1 ATP synthase subunit B [Rhodospirillales bacterium]